jgi:peptidyl-prolyl cis-trans isomerase SurA
MKLKITIIVIFSFIFNIYDHAYSWEQYDRVIATVNETPIIESELLRKFDLLQNQKKIAKKDLLNEKSRLLDSLINQALIEQTAERESIIVSPEKIENEIKKMMERMDIGEKETFIKQIEKTEKITYEEFREDIKQSLIRQQVMSIAIGISPPTAKDAEEWYNENKKELGYEVNIEQIMIKLKNASFSEEKAINNKAKKLYRRILSGEPFEKLAMEYSEDEESRNNGGRLGWVVLSDLARTDLLFANNIYKEFIIDKKKIAVVKSDSAYHVVKFNGKRPTAFETVKENILNLLYQKRAMEQLKKWADQRRLESDIKIFLEDYIVEKAES